MIRNGVKQTWTSAVTSRARRPLACELVAAHPEPSEIHQSAGRQKKNKKLNKKLWYSTGGGAHRCIRPSHLMLAYSLNAWCTTLREGAQRRSVWTRPLCLSDPKWEILEISEIYCTSALTRLSFARTCVRNTWAISATAYKGSLLAPQDNGFSCWQPPRA